MSSVKIKTAQIAQMLECYFSPDEAVRRASAISEDMAKIGFDVVPSFEVSAEEWRDHGARPQAEYILPQSPFSINASNGNQAMEGSYLTRGNLLRLSQTVELGRKWLPELRPKGFATRLLGAEHLDTLNEVWWLKFWRSLVSVRRGPKVSPNAKDADWLLTFHDGLADCTINLEVKRRTGNINTLFKHANPTVLLADVEKKFQPAGPETANIVALTIYHRPRPEAARRVAEWLIQKPAIDGVLVWIEANAGGEPLLKFLKPEKKWAEYLLMSPESEDLMIAGLARGTLCQPDEAPAFIERFR